MLEPVTALCRFRPAQLAKSASGPADLTAGRLRSPPGKIASARTGRVLLIRSRLWIYFAMQNTNEFAENGTEFAVTVDDQLKSYGGVVM